MEYTIQSQKKDGILEVKILQKYEENVLSFPNFRESGKILDQLVHAIENESNIFTHESKVYMPFNLKKGIKNESIERQYELEALYNLISEPTTLEKVLHRSSEVMPFAGMMTGIIGKTIFDVLYRDGTIFTTNPANLIEYGIASGFGSATGYLGKALTQGVIEHIEKKKDEELKQIEKPLHIYETLIDLEKDGRWIYEKKWNDVIAK